jgi:3-methyl-2-oxobutanoate hydroxymethyltransferase
MTRFSIRDFQQLKTDRTPITVITAYDAMTARLSEAAGINTLLVGDSMGMVIQGNEYPIPVRLEHIIYHTSIVARVTKKALIIADLPFMTYQISAEQAMTNAARLLQEGGASAVKLEGGEWLAPTVRRMVDAGMPVMGHIGLLPQSVHKMGGMRIQGRDLDTAQQLLRDAKALEQAGVFGMVIEGVPAPLAKMVTESVKVPTIGIGAGIHCDGQVQVFHDLFGLFEDFLPRHAKQYVDVGAILKDALEHYRRDVEARQFPSDENSFGMKPDVLEALQKSANGDERLARDQ